MTHTKALHVSANTLCPWLPEQNCIKRAALEGKGTQYLSRHFQEQFLITDFMKRRKGEN